MRSRNKKEVDLIWHGYSVAAIVPNYNYADFIIERIDSILAQTYPVSELIILDDASTDDSVEIIKNKVENIKKEFPSLKIKLLFNKKNSGGCVFSQWQKGINEVTSDYFWIAEADDSADEHFLEVAMQKFKEYPSAVLFYSDSYRIDQNGKIISETNSDWADMWGKGRWNKDYFNKGKDEIINYLGETNPILNVSSVVWKNNECLKRIFNEAKKYKVAGDWYIYTRVLEDGDIVYSAKPLNRYRKHNKGSASTVVKLMTEYEEVVSVQNRISEKYKLSKTNLEWQKVRRRGMGMVENKKNTNKKGRIAWLVPDFVGGSGGHRTIFQNINELVKNGYACDLYVKQPLYNERDPRTIYGEIVENYGDFMGDVYIGEELLTIKEYIAAVATSWDTARPVLNMNVEKKIYFIQDYEPWFFPMSENYLVAKDSYTYGFTGISIGKWLENKIRVEFDADISSFDFCVDLEIYKKISIKKENSICFVYQPLKPRRCADMGLKALQIVQQLRPDVKIYLYGSQIAEFSNINVEHLGIISTKECNELYNKCQVGLCMSSTNPSRIPFEMMAAGLPVVDLYKENNLYDLPEDGCLLADPSPEAIATAILKLLDDKELRRSLSDGGVRYMKKYPLEKGFKQFIDNFDKCLKLNSAKKRKLKKLYCRDSVSSIIKRINLPEIKIKDFEQIQLEKRLAEELKAKAEEEKWRKNLTIPQRIYLKIRYILFGY